MYNFQEYYSPTGTGKTTNFLPSQMFNNRHWYNEFFLIGLDRSCIDEYYRYCKNVLGLKYYFSNHRKTAIGFFDLNPFLMKHDGQKLSEQLSLFLSEAGRESNVIIDEIGLVTTQAPEVVEHLKSIRHKLGMITVVGQDRRQLKFDIDLY